MNLYIIRSLFTNSIVRHPDGGVRAFTNKKDAVKWARQHLGFVYMDKGRTSGCAVILKFRK